MVKVYVSSVVEAPAERVWERLRDFNAMPKWHPGIADSRIEGNQPADKIGCIQDTNAEVCAATDNSCLMHIGGGLRRQQSSIRCLHLAEILAGQEGQEGQEGREGREEGLKGKTDE